MKTLTVALKILSQGGAALRGDLLGVGQALDAISNRAKALTRQQRDLAEAMKRASGAGTLRGLQAQYDRLTQDIKRATAAAKEFKALQERQAAWSARADQLGGAARTGAMYTAATGAPVVAGAVNAANFEALLRDIAITGEFGRADETALGQQIRDAAIQFKSSAGDVGRAAQVLVANGLQSPAELGRLLPQIAKTSVAYGATPEDLANTVTSLTKTLGVADDELTKALAGIAKSTKAGQFEFRDMARWIPGLAPMMADMGMTGQQGVAEMAAALQVARKGAGSSDEAANNLRNYLQKLNSPDTQKDFGKAGIDLQASLKNLAARGVNPIEGSLRIIDQYMSRQSADTQRLYAIAQKSQDPAQAQRAIDALGRSGALGALFQDMQAMAFIRPALQNRAFYQQVRADAMNPGDVIDADWKNRVDQATFAWQDFKTAVWAASVAVGRGVLPALTWAGSIITPVIRGVTALAERFPRLTGVVALAVPGLAGVATALLAVGFVAAKLASFTSGARIAFMALAWTAPALLRLPLALKAVAGGVLTLGRALLLNPIGLAIAGFAALAVGAYLVWRYWDEIKAAFSAAYDWLVNLGGRMFDAGANLLRQLANGMRSMLPDVSGMLSRINGFTGLRNAFSAAAAPTPTQPAAIARAGGLNARIAAVQPALRQGGQTTVTYAPSITVQGNGTAGEEVAKALELDRRRFGDMLRRHQSDQARVAY